MKQADPELCQNIFCNAFGATLEIFPGGDGKITAKLINDMVARAQELSKEPHTCRTDQFNNEDNQNAYHEMARKPARQEGIFGGTTSGTHVWAAIQRARITGAGKKIITVIVDTG